MSAKHSKHTAKPSVRSQAADCGRVPSQRGRTRKSGTQPCRSKKEHKIQMIGCVDFYLMYNLKLIPNISSQKKAVSSNLTDDFELSICILGPLTKYSINTATFVCVSVCKLHDKNHLRQSPESHKARPSTKPTVRLATKLTFLFKSRACFQTLRRSPACPAWFSHWPCIPSAYPGACLLWESKAWSDLTLGRAAHRQCWQTGWHFLKQWNRQQGTSPLGTRVKKMVKDYAADLGTKLQSRQASGLLRRGDSLEVTPWGDPVSAKTWGLQMHHPVPSHRLLERHGCPPLLAPC